ncbi:MAG: SLBB domain-containing protein, partial [Nitrospinota bacterium]
GWRESRSPYPSQGSFYDLLVDDLNGDGSFDLAVAGWGQGVRVFWSITGEGMARRESEKPLAAGYRPRGGSRSGIPPGEMPMPFRLAQADAQEKVPPKPTSPEGASPPLKKVPDPERLRELRRGAAFVEREGTAEYIIGPGDILLITLWRGTRGERSEVPVNDRGRITFTFLDDLPAAGLTLGELDDLITEKLRGFVKNPRIEVFVKKYASKSVAIMGEVRRTGPFPLRGRTTLLDLLLEAGGQTPKSDLSKVKLMRKGRTITVDLTKAIFQGDQTQNPVLQASDRIFIPPVEVPDPEKLMKRIFVFGEVKSPGVYSFKREVSAIEAIARAGGLTKYSVHEDTKIIRGDLDRPEVLTANLRRLLEEGDPRDNLFLKHRDVVFVPRSIMGDVNEWISKVRPVLDFFLLPGIYRDTYALNRNVLRFDIGGPSAREAEKKSGGTFGAASPLFFGLR